MIPAQVPDTKSGTPCSAIVAADPDAEHRRQSLLSAEELELLAISTNS